MRPKHSKSRESFIDKYTRLLKEKATSLQSRYYTELLDKFVSELEIDSSGNIKSNTKNRNLVRRLTKIHNDFADEEFTTLLEWLLNRMSDLNKLNRKYFNAQIDVDTKLSEKIEDKQFEELGYEDDKIKKDSFLYDVKESKSALDKLKRFAASAVIGGVAIKVFKKTFKDLVKGTDERLGLIDSFVSERIVDIFTIHDRAIGDRYSKELKMGAAIFNGPDLPGSRQWCLEKKGQVFTKKEIESWRNESWQGKNDNYNPVRDVGGHNCVDVLDWITDELAKELRPNINLAA